MDSLITGAINFQQAKMATQVQYAVARKMLDAQESEGAAAVKLIQAASQTSSQAGDQFVAAATGLGGQLDVYA